MEELIKTVRQYNGNIPVVWGNGHPNCEQQEQIANELISFLKNNKKTG